MVGDVIDAPLEPGTSVYLTALPGDRPQDILSTATRLKEAGLNPVPHLGARYVARHDDLDRLMRGLRAVGVSQVLVIGGDLDRPCGPFSSALDLLGTDAFRRAEFRRVGLAAYPEGHPRIPPPVLAEAMACKIDFLRRRGVAPYVVTQFCFAAAPIAAWLDRFAEAFPDIPVHVGLAGPARIGTLLKYGVACGIGASLRAVRRNAGIARLITEIDPAPIIRDLWTIVAPARRPAQFHFFTFGGIARTVNWVDVTTAEGRHDMPRAGLR
ncbi:MAG TPA: methylenetetrahydrofolate reductase [Stellaceae bacterium]|nr:methylenetetrahydrofolate reductase [Stellaceae bacterium]